MSALQRTKNQGFYLERLPQLRGASWVCFWVCFWVASPSLSGASIPLEATVGRNETRIWSDRWVPRVGVSLKAQAFKERLGRLGYSEVKTKPSRARTWSRQGQVLWVFRPAHRSGGQWRSERLFGLQIHPSSDVVVQGVRPNGEVFKIQESGALYLEPELLAESLGQDRALREPVLLSDVPAHVGQALLALEDSRFYSHFGVDPKGILRAVVANVKAGRTVQGASTITQQLIKNRDLSATQSLDRKASEAARALVLEARYGKAEILQSYLNHVYYGHVKGVGIYGVGSAARVFFSKPASQLTLNESATLAAIVQGPNALSPVRHPQAAQARRDKALDRMLSLGWIDAAAVAAAKARSLGLKTSSPRRPAAVSLRSYLKREAKSHAPQRFQKGRGVWIETTIDPVLQSRAETTVKTSLLALRKSYPKLASLDLNASMVVVDGSTGKILAHVGGDPAQTSDSFDRVSQAKRQPGSLVKPFLALEAYERCGSEAVLNPASRVSDAAISIGSGATAWRPQNYDRKHHGAPLLHEALVHSYNIPFVRVARHCGWEAMADRVALAGLSLPLSPPPSFVLGAIEVSPLEIAEAYTTFSGRLGQRVRPVAFTNFQGSAGNALVRTHRRRVSSSASAWLVAQNLEAVVARGTGRSARLKGRAVRGKTGTSSDLRDAWFVAEVEGVVFVVWVGLDGGGRLGLTGSQAAAPLFVRLVKSAGGLLNPKTQTQPSSLRRVWVDPSTGWAVKPETRDALPIWFRGQQYPGKRLFWKEASAPILK